MYMVHHPKEPGSPEELPEWVSSLKTEQRMQSYDLLTRKTALRSAACAYISNSKVRECIFKHKGDRCYICGKPADSIDHKISVWKFVYHPDEFDYRRMNDYSNLFPMCMSCNSKYK